MINNFVNWITNGLLNIFKLPEIVTILISVLPIVEARGAIPIAIGYGINPFLAGLYAFIGSSLIVPILLLILLPIINWLSKTKIFKKAANVVYEKFEKKSAVIASSTTDTSSAKKIEFKKLLGVFLFVAIPLPLTGVWTGSAVAAMLKIKYPKAILCIVAGNLVASTILTVLCAFLPIKAINYVILVVGLIAVAVVITLIVKIILHKPQQPTDQAQQLQEETPNKEDK